MVQNIHDILVVVKIWKMNIDKVNGATGV